VKVHDLLAVGEIPRSGYPTSEIHRWCGSDSDPTGVQNGLIESAPSEGLPPIHYRFNSRGYRCAEFDRKADLRVVTLGCSYTFGIGVAEEETFSHLVTRQLADELEVSAVNWNLAIPGASNDYMTRALHLALPVLDPHVVLLFFTHLSRREYIAASNRNIHYNPNRMHNPSRWDLDITANIDSLISEPDNQLNLFRNYKAAEAALRGRIWYFGFRYDKSVVEAAPHLDRERLIEPMLWMDFARDQLHFGPETHRDIQGKFWQKLGTPENLQTLAGFCRS